MENNYLWHAGKISEKQLARAIESLDCIYGKERRNV